ncbi:hypothetical protein [Methylomonas sp. MK1]
MNKGRSTKFRLFIATQNFTDFAARTGSQDKARQCWVTSITDRPAHHRQ